jgi:hypothetical protein
MLLVVCSEIYAFHHAGTCSKVKILGIDGVGEEKQEGKG